MDVDTGMVLSTRTGKTGSSEIQVAARGPEPMVAFRYVNGVRIALDPGHQGEPFAAAAAVHHGVPGMGNPSSTESGGDPISSDVDGAHADSRMANVGRPLQTIVEGGASAWEVRTLWILKKCARYKTDVSMTVVRMSASRVLMGFLALAVMCFMGLRAWQGPQRHVDVFLRGIGLGEYFPMFVEHRYVMLEDVINIVDEVELVNIGVPFKAERQRILRHAAALRTHRSVVVAVLWGLFCLGCALCAVLIGCILVSPGARNRVACCLVWCAFMGWYKIRLWYRLWNTIDIERMPRLQSVPALPPRAPGSAVNPPSESCGSPPTTRAASRGTG